MMQQSIKELLQTKLAQNEELEKLRAEAPDRPRRQSWYESHLKANADAIESPTKADGTVLW